MPAHFKQTGSEPDRYEPDDFSVTAPMTPTTPARRTRGGDESYHAPAGNRHAASAAGNQAVGFKSVVGPGDHARSGSRGAHDRRRRGEYVDTDPYDLKSRRDDGPGRRGVRILSTVLLVLGLLLLVGAGGMWLYNQYQYHEQDVINQKLATYATVDDSGSTPPVVDWAALKAVNPDVVGWIQIPGTVVNYPVYQGSDNDEYLHTNAEGDYSIGGQIFLDSSNTAPGMLDQQTIVYGHHLYNGAMFKAVADMENQGMFDSVDTVWYVTEQATYELRPLFAYKTDGEDENVRIFQWGSVDELHSYLASLASGASAKASDTDALIAGAEQVLSLCTCSYTANETGRVILVCVPKAQPDGAVADAPTADQADATADADAGTAQ